MFRQENLLPLLHLIRHCGGVSAIEYGLLAALVAMSVLAAFSRMTHMFDPAWAVIETIFSTAANQVN